MVVIAPYLWQSVLVCISDHYFWSVGKTMVGKVATRIAIMLYVTNYHFNAILMRCFTNGVEAMLVVIGMHFCIRVKNRFDHNTAWLTALITISFVIRNTSPIGWLPILFLKIVNEGSFVPFLIAGFVVALPLLGISVLLDSLFFGNLTFTSWNFVNINVL